MPQPDHTNDLFHLAANYINETNRHIFLTGKAGTGKTTFLKYIRENTSKNTVVVAPTGVAAINAGGVTMHSFFQLPFGPYVPSGAHLFGVDNGVTDTHALFRNIRFNYEKKELIREMELLIIDEVSMVRSDTLDAIDAILRHFRNQPLVPFGGVQVLYIGDLFQLPPVMPDDQWQLLKGHYESVFFFHARVLQQAPPIYIELKKIYRQNERTFIDILNGVRNCTLDWEGITTLNERYDPQFTGEGDQYIVLTTHNRRADEINAARLANMPGEIYRFTGEIKGDFSDKALPTDMLLQIKPGTQVMFIKNDLAEPRRYFNGKLATVERVIDDNKIVVVLAGSNETLVLEKETWRNIRYSLNKTEGTVEEEEVGSFTQYPIRLAWAITIHKSQGLTFERAIIDAGQSFAPGQVYVALSRCTSLNGMVLYSKISRRSVSTDERVVRFAAEESSADELQPILQEERQQFVLNSVLDIFDWSKTTDELMLFREYLEERKFKGKELAEACVQKLIDSAAAQQATALKFQEQLKRLFTEACQKNDFHPLQARVEAAIRYFSGQVDEEFLALLKEHQQQMKAKAKVKGYLKELKVLINSVESLKEHFQRAIPILERFPNSFSPADHTD